MKLVLSYLLGAATATSWCLAARFGYASLGEWLGALWLIPAALTALTILAVHELKD